MLNSEKHIYKIEDLYAFRIFERGADPSFSATMYSFNELCADYSRRYNSLSEGYQKARIRTEIEKAIRYAFIAKGGNPHNKYALYFAIGQEPIDYILSSFRDPMILKIPLARFKDMSVSFTYGNAAVSFFRRDCHITERKVFTLPEIINTINQYGLLLTYNSRKSFVEMQLWEDLFDGYDKYIL